MTMPQFSEQDAWAALIKRTHRASTKLTLRLGLLREIEASYADFVQLVEDALDHVTVQMARQKNVINPLNEDQLTNQVISILSAMGFDARFEQNNGGNCDITIEDYNDMVWLGEAKIYKSGRNLLSGLQQLVDRYASGLPNQDRGALIIYMKVRNAAKVMEIWRLRLERKLANGVVQAMDLSGLTFRHTVRHAGSGRDLDIKHLPVVLFHKPTEVEGSANWDDDKPLIIGSTRSR